MLAFLSKVFHRKDPHVVTRAPGPLPCLKTDIMVPYCQWRRGQNCSDSTRRSMCIGIWEKGISGR